MNWLLLPWNILMTGLLGQRGDKTCILGHKHQHQPSQGRISYLLLLYISPPSFISLLPALSSHLYISHHYIIGRVVSPSWMLNLVLVVFNHHHPLMILRTGHFYDMQRLWLLVIIISNGSIVIVRIEKRGNTF